jgi:hypothetical protein
MLLGAATQSNIPATRMVMGRSNRGGWEKTGVPGRRGSRREYRGQSSIEEGCGPEGVTVSVVLCVQCAVCGALWQRLA